MGRFILRRIVHGFIVICCVTLIVFVVTRMIGDPVQVMLPIGATDQERAEFAHNLGLDRPILVQFVDYVKGAVTLDFGDSIWQRRPVFDIIFERLLNSLLLTFTAICLALGLAIPLGILAALKPGSIVDRVTVVFSLFFLSLPQFWLGLLLILLFAVELHWLPTSGFRGISSIILPALTLALPAMTRLVLIARSSMIDELNQQYVKTVKAKGMPFFRMVAIHAFRNGAIAVTTLAGWELVEALAGTIIVETVFAWPGLGHTTMQAITKRDLVLLQAIVLTITFLVVVANVLIDILQKAIDPRVRLA